MRNYKFRLYPTKKQAKMLEKQLELCRLVYNDFLEIKKTIWKNEKKHVTAFDLINTLPEKKRLNPELKLVHANTLQNLAIRLEKSFKGFFRRVRNGEKPGYPRFKGEGRLKSLPYPKYGNGIKFTNDSKRIVVSKVGNIKCVKHREFINPKCATIKKCGDQWFIIVCCDVDVKVVTPKTGKMCGIDVGITTFAMFSDGTKVENPRFFENMQKRIGKAQRSKKSKVLRKLHQKVANQREDFCRKLVNEIVVTYDLIFVENLDINRMSAKRWCSKQICDAAWGNFIQKLIVKAEDADKKVIKVNPAYTSQTCSNCGVRQIKKLSERTFDCCCGLSMDRDLNAAQNILALGRQSLASA